MLRQVMLWASERRWLSRRVTSLPFVRRAVRRFMPGETADDAFRAATELGRHELGSLLTLLGENVADGGAARAVAEHYQEVVARIGDRGASLEISVKPTHLGLDFDPQLARRQLAALAAAAARGGGLVWVDMESSAYTDATLELYRAVRSAHANVGLCLQAYLRRTAADLDALLPLHPAIRLVKGAYAEPARIAYPDKGDVDASFLDLTRRLLAARAAGRGRLALGTHDLRLVEQAGAAAASAGVARDGYEIQMLYGIQAVAQRELAATGHDVRVLISYGEAWFPWYMRRLAERPANLWFVVRSLFRR